MNGRRQLLGAVGLGSLLAGVTAVVPGEGFAATAKPRPTLRPIPPDQRPQYRVFTVPAGDSIEDAFNAVAREGFHYAGSAQRYGHTEFIFVKWVVAEPMISENALVMRAASTMFAARAAAVESAFEIARKPTS